MEATTWPEAAVYIVLLVCCFGLFGFLCYMAMKDTKDE